MKFRVTFEYRGQVIGAKCENIESLKTMVANCGGEAATYYRRNPDEADAEKWMVI